MRLSGRGPAPGLSERGRAEAARLTAFLADRPLACVQASPRARAQETAASLAAARNVAVETEEALDEVDFGEWTGQRYDELDRQPAWDRWNAERATARVPGGESMGEAQRRAMDHVRGTAARFAGKTVAMVSHCDIIRAVIAGTMGLSLDRLLSFEVDPASVSRLIVADWGARVASVNEGVFA